MKWTPPARRPEARGAARSRTTGQSADRLFGVPPVSRTYWRSLAQIEDRPEFRDALEREFPEGASELPEGITRRDMMMLARAPRCRSRGSRGAGARSKRSSRMSPLPRRCVPGIPAPLRDDDAVPPERVRPDRREPRRAADEDRGQPVAPLDARGLELHASRRRCSASTIPTARSRSRCSGARKSWSDFVDRLGAARRGSCRGWRRRPCDPLRVLLLAHPGAAGVRAPCPLPAGAVGDLRRRQRREPARGSAARHRARRRSHAPARSRRGDSRPRRRPAAHRPGDDPSRARLRGRDGAREPPAAR